MQAAPAKRNLLLCFDAFGTLFAPSIPIPRAYARAAARHGILVSDTPEGESRVGARFKEAFKTESKKNPNYGIVTGLGAERWWGNIIRNTFTSFLKPGQEVPPALVTDLLEQFSTDRGYTLKPDVIDFFQELRKKKTTGKTQAMPWPFQKTVVGIITNSDHRVPGILESFGLNVSKQRVGESSRLAKPSSEHDIDFVVLSYDVGYEKPDRRIFDAATQLLADSLKEDGEGLTTDDFERLYVGDEIEKDYIGARAAGWDAVLLDRHDSTKGDSRSNDENFSFGELEVKDKEGNDRKVTMAKTLFALQEWRPRGCV
ncbi:HAD-like domain-containing protein [Paraphoma chrysanthemicola]|uniref:HAD-like domain-containing protein n=1 Tax=Paraphoma chrysanthemicola TaxID=798071 RepID=A0A8K0R8U1_9PLEO|nr:HAD-like domain-containing protein [Paraphoma chrysanthemicola]